MAWDKGLLHLLETGHTAFSKALAKRRGSTCDSVWPGLACTCVDLRWLALTLVEVKFARKSAQIFHHLASQPPKSRQVEWLSVSQWNTVYGALKWVGCDLRVLARETCVSVSPPSLYVSSACGNLWSFACPCVQDYNKKSTRSLEGFSHIPMSCYFFYGNRWLMHLTSISHHFPNRESQLNESQGVQTTEMFSLVISSSFSCTEAFFFITSPL